MQLFLVIIETEQKDYSSAVYSVRQKKYPLKLFAIF